MTEKTHAKSRSRKAMKKHEACYWLNVLAEEVRGQIEISRRRLKVGDPAAGKMDQAEVDRNNEWRDREIKRNELKLEAIEIAASALTK